MHQDWNTLFIENTRSQRRDYHQPSDKYSLRSPRNQPEASFRCGSCGALVLADFMISGVRNRNHCPYCLCSRHLDWREAGDRLSACKALMEPVGLVLKKTSKKYGPDRSGELMLAHRCQECGKLSLNRIAADDDAEKILAMLDGSGQPTAGGNRLHPEAGIDLLTPRDLPLVEGLLYGNISQPAGDLEVCCELGR